jgi:acyl transferase domain-containing protein/NADPH:quinone reductase-like Zn-dependent oxidoreductase/acyl carrier protein
MISIKSKIEKIWSTIFTGKDNFAQNESFSSLGGNAKLADKLFLLLETEFGSELRISPTVAYDYSTLEKQIAYIEELIKQQDKNANSNTIKNIKEGTFFHAEPIAIIGFSFRFPGGINTSEELWDLLLNGKDALEEIPASRWNIDDYYDPDRKVPGKMVCRKGGFISDHDKFDADFFKISPKEARFMDPNQRIALETTWHALENAGIDPQSLVDSDTGVFAGVMFHDYEVLLERQYLEKENTKYLNIGTSSGAVAGRISYSLGLQGPSLSIDTACSSSLTAIHEACQHLQLHECSLAIAGGVNLMLLPEVSISFSQANMLSPDGECRSFSDDGNGYVRSEGCGFVILKRLEDAIKNNDNILAVIKGSAVNQDGASSGITVPNRLAQQKMHSDALQRANLESANIDYIEAHGTGTPLGDPIEIGAIEHIYQGRDNLLYVGSIKSNLGHLEAASGVAGLIKVLLALKNGIIPPNAHFNKLNPRIHLDRIPAQIPLEPIAWPKKEGIPRRAGINSFGFTGTNAHLILEEAPAQKHPHSQLPLTKFKRTHFWFHERKKKVNESEIVLHPLLGVQIPSLVMQNTIAFQGGFSLQNNTLDYLKSHKIFNYILFPAAGYVELIIAAAQHNMNEHEVANIHLTEVSVELPLWLEDENEAIVQTIITPSESDHSDISIYAKKTSNNWNMHAQAKVLHSKEEHLETLDLPEILNRCSLQVSQQDLYTRLNEYGYNYGPEFQVINELAYNDDELVATLISAKEFEAKRQHYAFYPPLMDGPLQALVFLACQELDVFHEGEFIYLPIGFDSIHCYRDFYSAHYAYINVVNRGKMLLSADITLCDEDYHTVASFKGVKVKQVTKNGFEKILTGHQNIEKWCYEQEWVPITLEATADANNVLITADMIINEKNTAVENYRKILMYIHTMLHKNITNVSVQIVTHNSYPVLSTDQIDIDMGLLNGLLKTAILEYPELHIRQVDLDITTDYESILANLEYYHGEEQIIALRGKQWYGARINSSSDMAHDKNEIEILSSPYQIIKSPNGVLEDISTQSQNYPVLKDNEVLIEPLATGLNFRDVLNAMNLYPGNPGPLGIECAGIVRDVGKTVTQFHINDEVFGLADTCLSSYAIANQALIQSKPKNLDFAQASGIPIVFLTAFYCLVKIANLKPSETVLIHAAAGGVGLAAVQIAQYCKARIIATAGSDKKRQYLRDLGVEFILDSRSTDYEKEIAKITEQQGVDVVLNSLSGKGFIESSLASCGMNARFVEIGKRDIWTSEQVAAARSDIHYNIVALDEMAKATPFDVQQLFKELMELFNENQLKPVATVVYPVQQVTQALKALQQAAHIGKVVVTFPSSTVQFLAKASYLVTGGLGGIGLEVAKYLAAHGAKHIILVSRSTPQDYAKEIIKDLEKQGVQIYLERVDISDIVQVETMLLRRNQFNCPLKGIFHAAGTLDDAPLIKQTIKRFEAVQAAKAKGAWYLHEITSARGINLDYFVLFSSIASLNGTIGQANYAAANSYLDGLAHFRRQQGLVAQSINWGPWREVGMAKRLVGMYERQGYYPFKTQLAIEALDYAIRLNKVQIGFIDCNWKKIGAQFTATPSWLEKLIEKKRVEYFTIEKTNLAQLKSIIDQEVKSVLGVATLAENKGFFDAGMDSLSALELKNRLQAKFNQALSNTMAFDYPTIEKLTDYLAQQLQIIAPKITKETQAIVTENEPIAIIGLACRFPGGANSADEFWNLLEQGSDTSIEIPHTRWNIEEYYDPTPDKLGKMISRNSSLLNVPIDEFDANFFKISPKESEYLDPQQRLLLEITWEALENSGIAPDTLSGSNTGVFIGILSHDYEDLISQAQNNKVNAYLASGNMGSTASGRLSYTLGLQGPSISIDTACSSSLVALHSACQSLHLSECNMAIAGGVNLIISPMLNINFSQAHMLSPDGHCKTFDKRADGYVRGEGCGIIVLKRLSDAIRDNDRILSVIKGSAVNQDGASSGLTVPNGPAQEDVIKRALAQAKLNPDDIDYIEAHGTGTALGDPIEINAIYNVFKNPEREMLTIGTVKTNIGHLEAAAGIAGVIKTVLALQNEAIPKHLHFHERNPQIIDFNQIPAQLPLETLPWKKSDNRMRRAGVSSFAFSGTNAHVILEEAPKQENNSIRAALPKTHFNRQRYWAPELMLQNKQSLGEEVHPLLGMILPAIATSSDLIFNQKIDAAHDSLSYLQDHRVFQYKIFPGAGYIEQMLAALRFELKNNDAIRLENIEILSPLQLSKPVGMQVMVAENKTVTIFSKNEEGKWTKHAQGNIENNAVESANLVGINKIKARCNQGVDKEILYQKFEKQGLNYGLAFQSIQEIMFNENEALAFLSSEFNDTRYQLYPPLLDGALQVMAVALINDEDVYLPISVDAVTLYRPLEQSCYVHASFDKKELMLIDNAGKVLAHLTGVGLKKTNKAALRKLLAGENIEALLYQEYWHEYTPSINDSEVKETSIYDARKDKNITNVLFYLQQQLATSATSRYINIITENAVALNSNETINLEQAQFNGFIKTAIFEHPELNLRQVDVEPNQNIELVLGNINKDANRESIIAYRNNKYYVPRLEKLAGLSRPIGDYRLIKNQSGIIDQLQLVEEEIIFPDENQIVISPKAIGLNFRDVLNAMNLYPGDPGPLGSDCAGVIIAVGEKVSDFKIGDEVLGIATGCLASQAITNEKLIINKPANLNMAQSASIPTVFLTAYYSLITLAELNENDTVLIHAGTGGVGLAAIQVAQYCKARIIATAGNEEKRNYLKSLGIQHVLDSRSLSFKEEIARITNNKGVDVVLNSLTGPGFIDASVACLSQKGCFIEIGKRDIWTVKQMNDIRPDVKYLIVALDKMYEQEPKLIKSLFVKVMKLFDEKQLNPIPYTEFTLSESIDAFKYLQKAQQIGKVVISMPPKDIHFDSHASYLITGGLGGIGIELCKYLNEKGAGRIILASRSAPSENTNKVLSQLNFETKIYQVDMSNQHEVEELIQYSNHKDYPLKGIFHAAGVLDDAPLDKQTSQRIENVFAAKALGAWYLHESLNTISLDYFVLFSSVASLIGNAGQSNYAAANSYLDGLAYYRKQQGLPALSINWGPWREVGMAKDLISTHERQGWIPLKTQEALEALDYALRSDMAELGIIKIDWKRMSEQLLNIPSWLSTLAQQKEESSLIKQLQEAQISEREQLLKKVVLKEIKAVMKMEVINDDKGFFDLGMDSLMALELKNRLQTLINQNLSNTIIFDYPNLSALLTQLMLKLNTLFEVNEKPEDKLEESDLKEIESSIKQLDTDDVVARLLAKLKKSDDK